ncbi:MAG: D-Ala-D-Ala carboxypeptidase family metallohydrolase [Cyanobacteria bacterium P01_F01_bin.150]
MKITATSDTIFKQRVKQSRELAREDKFLVKKGSEYDIENVTAASDQHLKVLLQSPLGPQSHRSWYVFSEHVALLGNGESNGLQEEDDPEPPKDFPDGFMLPGYTNRFYLPDPVLKGGNFTWAEVTRNGQCLPADKDVVNNILRMADTMQDIRELFGNRPIKITSWYRDPVFNRRVGGPTQSIHLTGGAVNFYIAGVSPTEVYQRLGPWWGSQGGLAIASGFTHIDNRGYRARWRYDS